MERKNQKKDVLKLSEIDRKVILSYSLNAPDTVIKPADMKTSYEEQIIKVE